MSEYEQTLGNDIAGELERLWPREGVWKPGAGRTGGVEAHTKGIVEAGPT